MSQDWVALEQEHATGQVEPDASGTVPLRLGPGLRIIARDGRRWQVGTEDPRRVILDGPEGHLEPLLRTWSALPGQDPPASGNRREPLLAGEIATGLIELGMLARVLDEDDTAIGTAAERAGLAHLYGADRADLMLHRRAEASVEVRGSGGVAAQLALVLVAAGVGHVHHCPTRPLHRGDVLPPPPQHLADDRQRLAARLTSVSDRTKVYPIAGHQAPTIVVLAGDGPADATDGKPLVDAKTTHLASWAGPAKAVVGPMVIPGQSSCLWCAELVRAEADQGWPLVRQAIHEQPFEPPALLAMAAATLAAGQVLTYIEGERAPDTVDGTLEWDAGNPPRRRSWRRHPDCGCYR